VSDPGNGARGDADAPDGWPVTLRGVMESVVTTLGPNGRWNAAALGVHAPEGDGPATARTWGRTRTRRNFDERGGGYVGFTADPVTFVDAALSIHEVDEPVLETADAWVRVTADRIDSGASGGTGWVDWALHPEDAAVERRTVPTTNRGYGAVIEATVAASRLGVAAYDRERLVARLEHHADVVDRCGGPREREAFERIREHADW
jgi:hypothetical protein